MSNQSEDGWYPECCFCGMANLGSEVVCKSCYNKARAEQDKKVKELKDKIEYLPVTDNNKPIREKEIALILTSYKRMMLDKINKIFGAGHRTSSSSQTKEELSSGGTK